MISRVHNSILQGIDAVACEVEADVILVRFLADAVGFLSRHRKTASL